MSYFKTRKEHALLELAKRSREKSYQRNCDTWLRDRFGEKETLYKWSVLPEYENHEWDGTPDPFFTAIKALADGRWVGIEAATSTGKTYFLPRIIYWFLDTFPNSLVITTAPKQDQLRKVLWHEMGQAFPKFKRIRNFAEFLTLSVKVDGRSARTMNMNKEGVYSDVAAPGHEAIGFVAGVGAGEDSATKFQGFHRENMLIVLDETPGIHAAVLTAIINTSTAKNNLVIAVGNPDSQIDPLHQFCELQRVEHIIISALDHPNVVCKKDIIPGAVTQSSIDFRRDEYGEESWLYKSRVRGLAPEQGAESLILGSWFDTCDVFEKDKFHGEERDDSESSNAVGIDVANSQNGDAAAVAFGRGNELTEIKEFQCPNANHLAYNLIYDTSTLRTKKCHVYEVPLLEHYEIEDRNIGVDGVGVGSATVNTFLDEGINCVSLMGGQLDYAMRTGTEGEDLYKFASLRAQMYWELREDLRTNSVIFNISNTKYRRQLKKELITPKFKIQGGKIFVESKEEIKKRLGKSPNLADAVVYWNWVRKNYYKQQTLHLPFIEANQR